MKWMVKCLLLMVMLLAGLSGFAQHKKAFKARQVYKSGRLLIRQISNHAFVHVSYLQTNDFGNVPCNGLVVQDSNEVIVFDTPTNDSASAELIQWIQETLHCRVKAVVPTHFHDDCLGGLKAFEEKGVASYANFKTIELAKEKGYTLPQQGFHDSIVLRMGSQDVLVKYFGAGHTRDNVVGYFAAENILFGGCLIKETGATKGYLGDAVTEAWPGTVQKIKEQFPALRIVVPGHGKYGGSALLDYTINLFSGK